ncbi:hypothetical protein GCM10010309_79050 [Streptomyces violaceochromogenes]|nr:hypothetical protein GCM10010309_79050 [Streptomyces violaceochromogenes]
MRQRYRGCRDRLVAALAERAPHVEVTGVAAGLHAVLRLPPGTEASAVKAAVSGSSARAVRHAAEQALRALPQQQLRWRADGTRPENRAEDSRGLSRSTSPKGKETPARQPRSPNVRPSRPVRAHVPGPLAVAIR